MRRDDGFTLVELVVAMAVGLVVLGAALTLLTTVMRQSHGVMERTDAMQRGRLALDSIVRDLRSQVCPGTAIPAVSAGSRTSITVFADLSDGSRAPDRRTVTLDQGAGSISEAVYPGSGPQGGPYTWSSTPDPRRTILDDAVEAPGTPFLRYFAFTTSGTPRTPTVALPTPLSAADAARVARVEIAFLARPSGARDDDGGVVLRDQVVVRSADPDAADPDPVCP